MRSVRFAGLFVGLIAAFCACARCFAATCTNTQLFDVLTSDVGPGVSQVLVGRMDADTLSDLVIVFGAAGRVEIRRHVSGTQFAAPATLVWPSPIRRALLADVDLDGKTDLVFTDDSSRVVIERGSGDGTVTLAQAITMPWSVFDLGAADFDNGGGLDVVVTHPAVGRVSVLMNASQPDYSRVTTNISTYVPDPRWVVIGKFNSDVFWDVVVSGGTTPRVYLLKGLGTGGIGTGSFSPSSSILPTSVAATLDASDLDGDGHPDVVIATSDVVLWLYGNGGASGTFSPGGARTLGGGPVTDVVVADLDVDGNRDLVCARQSSGLVTALMGAGSRTWGGSTDYTLRGQPASLAACALGGTAGSDLVAGTANGVDWLIRRCDPPPDPPTPPDPPPVAFDPDGPDQVDPPIPPLRQYVAPPPLPPPDPGPSPAVAAWPANGVVVCDAPGIQSELTGLDDYAHGAYFAWVDERSGEKNLYATRLGPDGAIIAGWQANGTPVCTAIGMQSSIRIFNNGTAGIWVTWLDQRDAEMAVYLQKLTADGHIAPGWPADGRIVCSAARSTWYEAFPDFRGGLFVLWRQSSADPNYAFGGSSTCFYAQHVDSNGVVQPGWPECGMRSGAYSQGYTYCYNQSWNFIGARPVWPDGIAVRLSTRFTCGGAAPPGSDCAWCSIGSTHSEGTVILSPAAGASAIAQRAALPSEAFAIDCNPTFEMAEGNGAYFSVDACQVLQRFGGPYLPSWSLPIPWDPAFLSDGWNNFTSLHFDGSLWRLSQVGNDGSWSSAFNQTGVPMCEAPCRSTNSLRTGDGSGGQLLVWVDTRSGTATATDLYASWLRADGTRGPGWRGDGDPIATTSTDEALATIVGDRRGSAIVGWSDTRNGNADLFAYRIVAQPISTLRRRVSTVPEASERASEPMKLTLAGARPNPSSHGTLVAFSLSRMGDATLQVLDVAGREMRRREMRGLAAGRHTVELGRSEPLAPGIYVLLLSAEGRRLESKVVVTR